MTAISTRTSPCCIEYTARGRRVTKDFHNANEAKAFYVKQDKAGRNPVVRKLWKLSKQGEAVFEDLYEGRVTKEEIVRGNLLSQADWKIIEQAKQEAEENGQEQLVDHQRRLMRWFKKSRPKQYQACIERRPHAEQVAAAQEDRKDKKAKKAQRAREGTV